MKNETNGLGIGIQLKAKTFMDYYDNKTFSCKFPLNTNHNYCLQNWSKNTGKNSKTP